MIAKIKYFMFNEKYHKMISNFSYLTLINVVNKLLPLIIIPYIVHTIGIEKFGIITFAWALIAFFILVTQYSFLLTAIKYISQYRDDIIKVSQHFWLVLSVRFIMFLLISIIFVFLLFTIERFYTQKEVFLFTFLALFADIIMPLWFFRGIEEMKYIAIFNIIAKIAYTLSIFLIITEETDYVWIPLLNSLALLMVNLYALYFAISRFEIELILPTWGEIKNAFIEGKDIFLSNMSVALYTTINIILLGFLTNYTVVGVYSLAESLFSAYNGIIKTYTMVVYPHLAKYTNSLEKMYIQARKFFLLYLSILTISAIFLFMISGFIIRLLYGEGHDTSIEILRIFAFALLLEPLGGFFTAYLSLKSEYKVIRSITFKTMLFNLVLVVPMILLFEAKGTAYLFILLSIVQVYLNLKHNREILSFRWEK